MAYRFHPVTQVSTVPDAMFRVFGKGLVHCFGNVIEKIVKCPGFCLPAFHPA